VSSPRFTGGGALAIPLGKDGLVAAVEPVGRGDETHIAIPPNVVVRRHVLADQANARPAALAVVVARANEYNLPGIPNVRPCGIVVSLAGRGAVQRCRCDTGEKPVPRNVAIVAQGENGKLSSNGCDTIQAVLFDLGDTLIHFTTSRARTIIRESCKPGHAKLIHDGHAPPDFERYLRALKRHFIGEWIHCKIIRREMRLMHCLSRLHARLGMNLDRAGLTELLHCTTGAAMQRLTTVDDQAIGMLDGLRDRHLQLGLISNTVFPSFAIDRYLAGAGLLDYFPVRVYSSEVRFMKPHRRIFELALDRLDVDPSRSLFVGDRWDKDVFGAARVGMKTALYAHGRPVKRRRIKPDYVIDCLSELPAIVSDA